MFLINMSNKFNIVKGSIEVIEKMVLLHLALFEELDKLKPLQEEHLIETSTKEYLQKALSNNEFISYIAETNSETVSICGISLFKGPPYSENSQGIEGYILSMYTVPKYRGNGLAKRLLGNCIEISKKSGVKRIWVHASEDGKHLYKKMGFTYTMKNNEMELFL
ncbi:acetyltransferase [Desulfoscipio gibsoniae DSM 7213]|uniref:Acetyltransferase n=2 Tax=Desulfoscipio gibsoniae TaxID=102134 RepID=R4KPG9_9FIRM|nr:acetyltransferase [Desulfoscipio gibsoniae DSM 7213]